MGSVVLVPGFLQGMGRGERCDVLARTIPGPHGRAYSEAFVIDAPADLPDGQYVATFDGFVLVSYKSRGLWFNSCDVSRATAA